MARNPFAASSQSKRKSLSAPDTPGKGRSAKRAKLPWQAPVDQVPAIKIEAEETRTELRAPSPTPSTYSRAGSVALDFGVTSAAAEKNKAVHGRDCLRVEGVLTLSMQIIKKMTAAALVALGLAKTSSDFKELYGMTSRGVQFAFVS